MLTRQKLVPLLALRRQCPLLLVDIAVPRDIEPEVNFLDDVYLYNVDDLQTIADDYMKLRREELAVCERIVQERAAALLSGVGGGATSTGDGSWCVVRGA